MGSNVKLSLIKRILSAKRYLSFADPVYRWRLGIGICPNCEQKKVFISLSQGYLESVNSAPFMCRCLGCRSNIINVSLISVIKRVLYLHLQAKNLIAWEMSTYGATLNFLKQNCAKVYQSEYYPSAKSGDVIDGILIQDCTKTSFPNDYLDLITSNQVLEHVPEFEKALAETYRILRPGGYFIFSVPLYLGITHQIATIDDLGDVVFFGQEEFHDSRLGGPNSAPVFWRHGIDDIEEILSSAGFICSLEKVMITKAQREPMIVLAAQKPA